jgi:hypothetical protein
MGQIDRNLIDMPDSVKNAEVVKSIVLERLKTDDILTEEQFELYNTDWNIIVYKPSWFKKWAARFTKQYGNDINSYYYKYVKF